jgi:hypothetical protein
MARVLVALALSVALSSAFAQATDPLVGRFSDGWLELSVTGGGGQYSGHIAVGGQTYPFVAQGGNGQLTGTYETGGQRYPFSAALQGDGMYLLNGTQAFQLARQAQQPTFPAAPAGQAPADPAAAQPAQPQQAQPQQAAGGFLPAGTRLTYKHAVASNPGAAAGPEAMGVAGQGYIEVDIFYSDAQVCVAKVNMYSAGLTVDSLTRTASDSVVGEGGLCSTYWAPPAVLAAYQAPAGGIQTVQRGPFELGGRSYDGLYIANQYENMRLTRVYDLATGILLSEVEASGQRNALGEQMGAASSGVQELINVRQVELPWSLSAPLPANVQNLQSLTYRGDVTTSVPGIYMWDSSMVSTFDFKVDIQQRGVNWLLGQSTMTSTIPGSNIPLPATQSQVLITAATGYYLPVEALAALQPGQVIDADPVTGIRTYVQSIDQNGVVIAGEGRGFKSAATYDLRTGFVVYSVIEQQTDGQNMVARQELVGAQ